MIERFSEPPHHKKAIGWYRVNQPNLGSIELQVTEYPDYICTALVNWETGEVLHHIDVGVPTLPEGPSAPPPLHPGR